MLAALRHWLPLAVLAAVALWLRTHDLARRPMHADEANQAVKTSELIEHGRYTFDPADHHGPTLYYAALPIAWVRGQTTLAAIDERTVRLVPAIAGTLAVLLLYFLAAGSSGSETSRVVSLVALAASAFFALSPPAVYYSRYFIQETLLVAFTLAAFVSTQRWWNTGRFRWAVAAGIALGLMLATKSSAPLFVGAGAIAAWVVRPSRPAASRMPVHLLLTAFVALLVAGLFYASFGSNPAGLRDAFASYFQGGSRAFGETGHEKPWWYYLQLFTWSRSGGLLWHQLAFSGLAVVGTLLSFRRGSPHRFARAAAVYTAVVAAALSLTPYKTPWHAIHLVPGLCVLAATATMARPRALALACFVVALGFQLQQMRLAVFQRPADARNPYAYVHSSPDVLKVRALADAALAQRPEGVIRIIGEEYWPLPWYLRGLDRVGYWPIAPEPCDGALVIATETQAATVRARLQGRYRESLLGLRPGVLCVVFTPES